MVVTALDYEQIALSEPHRKWELHRGELREKPVMSHGHHRALNRLDHQLQRQLSLDEFEVRVDVSRVRRSVESYYMPDLFVVPAQQMKQWDDQPERLEVFTEPLPLVVEVWSPSTGDYDIDSKLPEYQARGDHEIWRIHPFERTLTAWRRQPDGSYVGTVIHGGIVRPEALPGVTIDLDQVFG